MRIVFAGTPAPAVPSLRALLDSSHEVVAVVSRPDAPAGRGRKSEPSPISALAREAGIELLTPATARDPEFVAQARPNSRRTRRPWSPTERSCGSTCWTSRPTAGSTCTSRCCRPGAARLPCRQRSGPATTSPARPPSGWKPGLDTGPVYGLVTEAISHRPTPPARLLDRLSVSGSKLLVATMDGIADGSVIAVPQSADGVSLAAKITVAEARDRLVAAGDRRSTG